MCQEEIRLKNHPARRLTNTTKNQNNITIRVELLDELLKEYKKPEDLMGDGGILKELTKALVERCLNAEIEHHMSETRVQPESPKNRRNGYTPKTIKGTFGEAEIAMPRDRNGEFEPIIVPKGKPDLMVLTTRFLPYMREV